MIGRTMGKVFSRYLSVGSDSAIPANLARTPSLVLDSRKTQDGSLASSSEACSVAPPPKKGNTLADSPSKNVDVLPEAPAAQLVRSVDSGNPATNKAPDDDTRKDPDAPPVKRQPSPDASLQHLRLSNNQIPPPVSRPWPTTGPWQLFGVPLGSAAHEGLQLHQQSSTSEAVSQPSSVPLRHYSETNANSLAKRLHPVYKRDNRVKGSRTWFPTYSTCLALVGLSMSVLLLLALITSLLRRPVQTVQSGGLGAASSTRGLHEVTTSGAYTMRPPNESRFTGSFSATPTTETARTPSSLIT